MHYSSSKTFFILKTCALISHLAGGAKVECEIDATSGECIANDDAAPENEMCGIYFAPSTIPGAGLGIFTTIERKVGDTVGNGDVMIPISDLWYHYQNLRSEDRPFRPISESYLNPTEDYVWFGPELGMTWETAHPYAEKEYIVGFAPGVDAAINCHMALNNVDKKFPIYDTVNLHRSRDPGVGAFTPYHKCDTIVIEPIPPGGELFKVYGDRWFQTRFSMFGSIALSKDYPKAETVLEKLDNIFTEDEVPEEACKNFWDIIVNKLPFEKTRTMNAIPREYESLKIIAEKGMRAVYQPNATRSLDELQKIGRCADAIEPLPSTLKQAGRGAFATRHFTSGSIITGSPLLFLHHGAFFDMIEGNWFTKSMSEFQKGNVRSYQIMMNYCWHHEKKESSIYLCPYGAGINYINHNKTLANVRVQWPKDGEMGHDGSLLKRSPQSMFGIATPGLFMDVVALRDIIPGEELFMDYGDAWENAWNVHVEKWGKEVKFPDDYVSARDWNAMNSKVKLRTEEEQKAEPYPENFDLRCLTEIETKELDSEEAEELWLPNTWSYRCRILSRREVDDGSFQYLVSYFIEEELLPHAHHYDDEEAWTESDWIVREALRFFDRPYSTDLFLKEAFRHPVGLPDEMFPDAWRGVFIPPVAEIEEEEDVG